MTHKRISILDLMRRCDDELIYSPIQLSKDNPEWYAFISDRFLKRDEHWNLNMMEVPIGRSIILLMKDGDVLRMTANKVGFLNQIIYRNSFSGEPLKQPSSDIFAWQFFNNLNEEYQRKFSKK